MSSDNETRLYLPFAYTCYEITTLSARVGAQHEVHPDRLHPRDSSPGLFDTGRCRPPRSSRPPVGLARVRARCRRRFTSRIGNTMARFRTRPTLASGTRETRLPTRVVRRHRRDARARQPRGARVTADPRRIRPTERRRSRISRGCAIRDPQVELRPCHRGLRSLEPRTRPRRSVSCHRGRLLVPGHRRRRQRAHRPRHRRHR